MTDKINTGFIGVGDQGGPIARRMVDAGFPLTIWARRAESFDPYRDTAATFAGSIAELGAKVDHVGICVLDDTGVRAVCAELIPAMRPGALVAIHSTVHPDTCIEMADLAAKHGVALIDAPVSGGRPGAEAGTLAVMVGGAEEAFARARPVFESFGTTIVHLGDVGTGQMAKLINNSLMAANLALAVHALNAGAVLGIDRQALIDLIRVSSGRSMAFDVAARMTSPSAFHHGAMLLAKDIRLLGEVMGNDPAAMAFDQTASPFLTLAQT